ncbi:hypothetical protein INT45_005428 [Circinella minor]|uniref:Uncharacterized protein n=1 Tax=Circinella minor TaxID=1195481 RepID=A0A8H7VEN9_9FUNG|nr:hypothetical protein INT45_005428 [Circinella minor]
MSFVVGCSLTLQCEIDEEDLAKIKSNLHAWHIHLKDNVTPNMYTVNFHYLRHIHDTIKALGPLRGYSTRSAERAIGFFKRHVKSRASPWVNAGNIIKRQLIMWNFECVYNPDELLDEQPEENDYSVEGFPEAEMWDCHEGSIYDFLEDFDMREYIKKYWHNQFPDDRALTMPISTTIRVGKRLFMYGRTLYRCQKYPSTARNLDTLERPLCLVKLYSGVTVDKYGTTTRRKGGIPHVHHRADGSTPGDKLYVTDVENIKSYAGMLKSSLVDDRFYLIYPEMIPGDVKVTELSRV